MEQGKAVSSIIILSVFLIFITILAHYLRIPEMMHIGNITHTYALILFQCSYIHV